MRSTDLAISFFTFLTVLANLATVGVVGLAVAARGQVASAPRLWSALKTELADGGLRLAWLVAAVSTSGSLWFSEVAGFQPCRLCWIQRACMYPLTVVLAVAAWAAHRPSTRSGSGRSPAGPGLGDATAGARRSGAVGRRSRQVAVGLAVVGALVAAYHVVIERFPSLETGACDPTAPCTLVWFERLGFVTLPYMALSGFVLIVTLVGASTVRQPGVRGGAPAVPAPVPPVPEETLR